MFLQTTSAHEGQSCAAIGAGAVTAMLSTSPQLGDEMHFYTGAPFAMGTDNVPGRRPVNSYGRGCQREFGTRQVPNRGRAPSVALNLLAIAQPAPQSCRAVSSVQDCRSTVKLGSYIGSNYAPVTPPWFVQNTFVSTPLQRSPSLDGFYQERMVRSSPPSPPPIAPVAMLEFAVPGGDFQFMIPTPTGSEAGSMLLPPPSREFGLPNASALPVLRLSDVLGDTPQCKAAPGELGSNVDAWSTTDSTAADSIPGHLLSARLHTIDGRSSCGASSAGSAEIPGMGHHYQIGELKNIAKPELGSPELPSRGSTLHRWGVCKPCAFVFQSCDNGVDCQFCHLCDPGERKRRKKERLALKREHRMNMRPGHQLWVDHRT